MSMSGRAISVEDRMAIEDLLTEFSWRIDHGPARTVAELFVEHGTIVAPSFRLEGREAIGAHFGKHDADAKLWRHQWLNVRITPTGAARARVEGVQQTHVAAPADNLVIADTIDTVEKAANGTWRFVERELHVILKATLTLSFQATRKP